MKTFPGPNLLFALAAAVLIAGTAQCNNSNSISGPATAANVAGAWTGDFDSADPLDCNPGHQAQASFTVDGHNVVGTLNVQGDCGFQNVRFQGTIDGSMLKGTVTGDTFSNGSTAVGSVWGSTSSKLDLGLTNSFGLIPGGQMRLHR
jgi:hypothetical protein